MSADVVGQSSLADFIGHHDAFTPTTTPPTVEHVASLRQALCALLVPAERGMMPTVDAVRAARAAVGGVPTPPAHPAQQAPRATTRTAGAWNDRQLGMVRAAINKCIAAGDPFTADHVWERLPDGFPKTPGLAPMLRHLTDENVLTRTGTGYSRRLRMELAEYTPNTPVVP